MTQKVIKLVSSGVTEIGEVLDWNSRLDWCTIIFMLYKSIFMLSSKLGTRLDFEADQGQRSTGHANKFRHNPVG